MTIDVKPAEMTSDKRQSARSACGLPASLRERGRTPHFVHLSDLSENGGRLVGSPLVGGLNSSVWLTLASNVIVQGECVWSDGNDTGLRFANAISGDLLDHLLRANPPVDHIGGGEEAAISRREKIKLGYAEEPLLRRKQSKCAGKLSSTIARNETRRVSHRCEARFPIQYATAPDTVESSGERLTLRDISSSGLGIDCAINDEIGASVELSFPDCEPLQGRVVWRSEDRAGIELEPNAISLSDNDAE